MVYDKYENPLTEQDKKILKDWKKLDDKARSSAVQLWANTGKRIESERLPMIKNYFKQADLDFEAKVIPNVRKIEQDIIKSFSLTTK